MRALGHQLDEQRFITFALIETPTGFYVKGRSLLDSRGEGGMQSSPQNYPMTSEQLDALLADARARRRDGTTRRIRWLW